MRWNATRGVMFLAAATAVLMGACAADDGAEASRNDLDATVAFVSEDWPTDWSQATVDLADFILGVSATEPRDAIPPVDEPVFETVDEAAEWLADREPGALVTVGQQARFFPLSIINRHEIVNTEIDGVPIAVTYCPLCNTALAFDRRVEGETLRFGVSGLLRNSDLVMWDDRTVSLWQQITGEALVGEYAGTKLDLLSTAIVRFGDVRTNMPDTLSLSRDTGFDLAYGINRYEGYSDRITPMMPVLDEPDRRFPALERVVGVTIAGDDTAYPFSRLRAQPVVNDVVGGEPIVVLWGSPDTADALDAAVVATADAVGTAVAFRRTVDDMTLTFEASGDAFRDKETGSTWNILGQCVAGPLVGSQLEIAPHRNEFWFAWTAFFADGSVYGE